jgi:uncharacterized protein YraI
MKFAFIAFSIFLLSGTAQAQQADCPALERAAIAQSELWCSDLSAGNACYGSPRVVLTARPDASDSAFMALGDTVAAQAVQSLWSQTGEARYGLALARLNAYQDASWQTDAATLILLGDATIVNTAEEFSELQTQDVLVNEPLGVNLRAGPATGFRVMGAAIEGASVKVTGRTRNGWLRVQLPNGDNGWMTSAATDAETDALPIVSTDDAAPDLLYRPLTAFSLISAPEARCDAAPDSGVLLQANRQAEPLRFMVNGVMLLVRGTVFIQAQSEMGMTVNVVTGETVATIADETLTIEEGFALRQALTVDNESGPRPTDAEPRIFPYDYERIIKLPLDLLPLPAYYGLDLASIIAPRPESGASPLAGMLATDDCRITVGDGGANLRAGPGTDYAIRGVIGFRESAEPVGRTRGTDGFNWWQLALDVWLRTDTTVIGGDCAAVPDVEPPPPPPQPTPTPSAP